MFNMRLWFWTRSGNTFAPNPEDILYPDRAIGGRIISQPRPFNQVQGRIVNGSTAPREQIIGGQISTRDQVLIEGVMATGGEQQVGNQMTGGSEDVVEPTPPGHGLATGSNRTTNRDQQYEIVHIPTAERVALIELEATLARQRIVDNLPTGVLQVQAPREEKSYRIFPRRKVFQRQVAPGRVELESLELHRGIDSSEGVHLFNPGQVAETRQVPDPNHVAQQQQRIIEAQRVGYGYQPGRLGYQAAFDRRRMLGGPRVAMPTTETSTRLVANPVQTLGEREGVLAGQVARGNNLPSTSQNQNAPQTAVENSITFDRRRMQGGPRVAMPATETSTRLVAKPVQTLGEREGVLSGQVARGNNLPSTSQNQNVAQTAAQNSITFDRRRMLGGPRVPMPTPETSTRLVAKPVQKLGEREVVLAGQMATGNNLPSTSRNQNAPETIGQNSSTRPQPNFLVMKAGRDKPAPKPDFRCDVPGQITNRLQKDYLRMKKDPIPYVRAEVDDRNILKWHFIFQGPENTPYEGGYYRGVIKFPNQFPFKPPRIYMVTPNGRFQIRQSICLSISEHHPSTWNPAWTVGSILQALLSFMVEDIPTSGAVVTTREVRKILAERSIDHCLHDPAVTKFFPELCEELSAIMEARVAKEKKMDLPKDQNEETSGPNTSTNELSNNSPSGNIDSTLNNNNNDPSSI